MIKPILFILILCALLSCKNEKLEEGNLPPVIATASVDDILADSLSLFFKTNYFLEDSAFLKSDSVAFQFYKIDLNEDNKEEIFVRLKDDYFCSTEGCTFLLLDQKYNVLNRFTSMRPPLYVSQEVINGWNILLTYADGDLKEIVNKNNRYPSNPTKVPNSQRLIQKEDINMFDDEKSPCKTYYF